MDRVPCQVIAPPVAYVIRGRRYEAGAPHLAAAVVEAHAARQRPLCMCVPGSGGVEMYIARLPGSADTFIVKRMPDTGCQHAVDCPSYEPPADFSGLGQVLGHAIIEDPATGETTLKLGFPLSRMPGRSQMPPPGRDNDSVSSSGTKLSLRGLLHYLWDQAELTRWHPGFAGKRNWATVRQHLLRAAQHMIVKGVPLATRLYVPEPFSVDEREALNARRMRRWQQTIGQPGKAQPLGLLIGEIKEIAPARFGYKVIIKHVPDQPFAMDEQLYRRLGRRFEQELALWGADDDLHLVMVATFGLIPAGVPTLFELSLMPVTKHWIPCEDQDSGQLIGELVAQGRTFIKSLRYNTDPENSGACALLTDCEGAPVELCILRGRSDEDDLQSDQRSREGPHWRWRGHPDPVPDLPLRASKSR